MRNDSARRFGRLAVAAACVFLSGICLAAEPNKDWLDPLQVLKQKGALRITDGYSYFEFKNDGTFNSSPLGQSGRVFTGTWTLNKDNPATFVVKAKMYWMNGGQPQNDFRRIVFVIYNGRRAVHPRGWPFKNYFDGYFLIDELVKISKSEMEAPPNHSHERTGASEEGR